MSGTLSLLIRRDYISMVAVNKKMMIYLCLLLLVTTSFSPLVMGGYVSTFMTYLLSFGLAATEEQSGAQTMDFLLPVPLRETVKARFIMVFSATFIALAAVGIIHGLFIGLLPWADGISPVDILWNSVFSISLSMFILAGIMPCIYRYGTVKGRVAATAIYVFGFIISGIIGTRNLLGSNDAIDMPNQVIPINTIIMLAVGIAAMYASYRLSVRIVEKRRCEGRG